MLSTLPRTLVALFAIFCSAASGLAQGQDAVAPRRIVYLFAGQSNIFNLSRDLSQTCYTITAAPNNTRFFPPGSYTNTPLLEVGRLLGQAHALNNDNVDIVNMAVSGSALLKRNSNPPGYSQQSYWMDETNILGDANALLNWYVTGAASLLIPNQPPIDELHIVWGQGETDCISTNPFMPGFDYWFWCQRLMKEIAVKMSATTYHVHLVTIGAIEISPTASVPQDPLDVNEIRDAYFAMDRFVLPFTGMTPYYRTVAHHYDLLHATGGTDPYHLDPCAYVTLAQRIAAGILTPGWQPRLASGITLQPPNQFTVTVSTGLTTTSTGSAEKYFEVTVGGAVQTGFAVQAAGTTITFTLTQTLPTNPLITVRHVHGSGFGLLWANPAVPLRAATGGAPLEPFVVSFP